LAESQAQIALIEFRQEAEAILDEIRQIRDDFQGLLASAAKVLAEADRQGLERAIMEAIGRRDGCS
jgi:hypothetical protein